MRMLSAYVSIAALAALLVTPAFAKGPDLEVIHQIRQEAYDSSQVMDHIFYMTEVYGPRLTNSPGFDASAQHIVETLEEWGLENVALEPWEGFGNGWSQDYFSAHLTDPQYQSLTGFALTWTPGTDGKISGTPLLAILEQGDSLDESEGHIQRFMETWKGKLKGKIVLFGEPHRVEPGASADDIRLSGSDLARLNEAPEPVEPLDIDPENPQIPSNSQDRRRFFSQAPRWAIDAYRERRGALRDQLGQFLVDEGVALVVHPPRRGDGGTLFPPRGGSHDPESVQPPPSITLIAEHYNRLYRLLRKGQEPVIEVEVRATFHSGQAVNVVGEIPGGSKADEVVLLGAHLDDVAYATGATDNASGCAVMMEAVRLLKTLGLEMDRTVRLVLWSGEEQGLLGSRAYVEKHYGDPVTMELTPEHGKVSAYYNLDNGAGQIRGIYLQNNDMARSLFTSWLAPFRDFGAATVSSRRTGSTDHIPFDNVGIPGFQFIQDPLEYRSHTHHSNMDFYDRLVASDLIQSSAIVAAIVYHTANLDTLIPRKPLPKPQDSP